MTSLNPIETTAAFGPGCDVWIVSSLENSSWSRKLDWYLNFQIMKASEHRPRSLPEALLKIATEAEFELPSLAQQVEHSPLMIASAHLLPVAKTIVIPPRGNSKTWAKSCASICRRLFANTDTVADAAETTVKKGRVRIFLPDSIAVGEFQGTWPVDDESLLEIELVVGEHLSV